MIHEATVQYGDVFIWYSSIAPRRIMFVAWDDGASGEGRFWWGLDLNLRYNDGKPARRRGFRAQSTTGAVWERVK